jgi:hypothetical protein
MLHLTGAAIRVSRDSQLIMAARAGELGRWHLVVCTDSLHDAIGQCFSVLARKQSVGRIARRALLIERRIYEKG